MYICIWVIVIFIVRIVVIKLMIFIMENINSIYNYIIVILFYSFEN